MPIEGFGEGFLQGSQIANERKRIQLAADKQKRLNLFQDKVIDANERVNEVAAGAAQAISSLEEELGENKSKFQMLQLKEAANGMLGGDLSSMMDALQDPELKEVFMIDDGIKDFFDNQSGLVDVRPYNPNNPEEVKAHNRYIEDIGGGTPDFDATSIDENIYTYKMGDGSVVVYDRTAVARALGLGAEFTSIRNKIEEQDKIDEDLMKRKEALKESKSILESGKKEITSAAKPDLEQAKRDLLTAQQNLAAVDTSYQVPEGTTPLDQATLANKLLQNEKLIQDIENSGVKDPADLISSLPTLAKFVQTEEQLSQLFQVAGATEEAANSLAKSAFPAIKEDRELGKRETEAGIGKTESDTKLSDAKTAALAKEGTSEKETQEYMLKLGRAYGASKGADTSDDNAAIQLAEKAAKEGGFINEKGEYVSPTTQQVSEQKSMFKKLSPETEAEYIVKETAYDKEYGTALNAQSRKNLQAINQITAGSEGFATHLTGGEKGVIDSNIGNPIARVFNEQQNEADREGYIKLVGILVSQNFIQNRSSKYLVEQVMSAINANSLLSASERYSWYLNG